MGDFQGKRKNDVAVLSANALTVLVNDGAGRLSTARSVALHHAAHTLITADLLGNGRDALALANEDGTVSVFVGDGAYAVGADLSVGYLPTALLATDANKDGNVDLISVNSGANTFSVLAGQGNGSFGAVADYVVGDAPVSAAVGVFYADGAQGVATINSSGSSVSTTQTVNKIPLSLSVPSVSIVYGSATANLSATVVLSGAALPTNPVNFVVDSGTTVAATCVGTASPLSCTPQPHCWRAVMRSAFPLQRTRCTTLRRPRRS